MSDKSREDLEERVDELEATVKKMLPSRRQVLKGSATAAGAGMLGFSAGNASAQASTEDGDGNVGDPDDRVDVFGDGGDFNVVNAGKIKSESTAPDIVVCEIDGTFYAVGDSLIDSGSTPETVIQSAIDEIHNKWNNRDHSELPQSTAGTIDCKNIEITTDSTIDVKGGVHIGNLFIEDTTADPPIRSDPGSGKYRCIVLENIAVQYAPGISFDIVSTNNSRFYQIACHDAGDNGINISGSLYNEFNSCISRGGTGTGFYLNAEGSVQSNHNAFRNCYSNHNDSRGYALFDAYGNVFEACAAESNGGRGFEPGSTAHATTFISTWSESNGDYGLVVNGEYSTAINHRAYGVDDGIRIAGNHGRVVNPNLDNGAELNPAALCWVDGVDLSDIDTNIETDLMIVNGWGDNGTDDPASAGPWNGNGFEGAAVTGNGEKHVYRGGTWV